MKTSRRVPRGLALLLATLWGRCLAASVAGSGQEVGDARRGREIYVSGLDAAGAEIKCTTGVKGVESSAAVLKCVNCHGADGRGDAGGATLRIPSRLHTIVHVYAEPAHGGQRRASAGIDLAKACLALPVRWLESPPLREMGDSSLPLSDNLRSQPDDNRSRLARMPDSHF